LDSTVEILIILTLVTVYFGYPGTLEMVLSVLVCHCFRIDCWWHENTNMLLARTFNYFFSL